MSAKIRTITEMFKKYENKHKISKKEYLAIAKMFSLCVINETVHKGQAVKLPHNLGHLVILKQKTPKNQRKLIDLNHYMKTGEKIPWKNKHSEGHYASIKWAVNPLWGSMKRALQFKATKAYKTQLAQAIRDDNTMALYYPRNYYQEILKSWHTK